MRIGNIIAFTEVEGPGLRTALWVQGCSIQCKDCCNPQYLDFSNGKEVSARKIAEQIACLNVEGITLLGGEPLDQFEELAEFIFRFREITEKGIILFTGYEWEVVKAHSQWFSLASQCDLVKCGPFRKAQHPDTRRWIGSKNQTVHFMTNRYKTLQQKWDAPRNEFEIHISDDEIMVNGTPLSETDFLLPPIIPGAPSSTDEHE